MASEKVTKTPVFQLSSNFGLMYKLGKFWRRASKFGLRMKHRLLKNYTVERMDEIKETYSAEPTFFWRRTRKSEENKFINKFVKEFLIYLQYHSKMIEVIEKIIVLEERENFSELLETEKLLEQLETPLKEADKNVVFSDKTLDLFKGDVKEFLKSLQEQIHRAAQDDMAEEKGKHIRGFFGRILFSQTRGARKFTKLSSEWHKDADKLRERYDEIKKQITETGLQRGITDDLIIYFKEARKLNELLEVIREDLDREADSLFTEYKEVLESVKELYSHIYNKDDKRFKEIDEEMEKHIEIAKKYQEFIKTKDIWNLKRFAALLEEMKKSVDGFIAEATTAREKGVSAGAEAIDKAIRASTPGE
ncbi:hypothetical protein ACFL0W_05050 [Nanoarchaeota archaeon]